MKIVNKRDKEFAGELVEFDDDVVVIKQADGEEVEFARDRIASITVIGGTPAKSSRRKADEDDEPEVVEPEVSDTVEITNSRDKVSLGNIVEIDDKLVVIKKADGEEVEFARDRVKSIVVKVKNAGKGKADTKADDKPAKGKEKAEPTKRATREDNGGVSVGQRMRDLIIADLSADREAISKALKKESLEFKDNTLDLVYKDVHKIVGMLKAAKLMK